jgi:serine/threonine-protein kinase
MSETLLNGRYALVAQQGSGGMSVIYRAVDRLLQRNVAVKILRPSLTTDPAFLEKFRNEARSIANLSHPNIVTVFDVGSDGSTHYIVMELVDGQDLKKIIKASGAMPVDKVIDIITQICAGIGYAHRSGIVHADIKPQNVLMTRDEKVKVTDFGIAQALSDTQPQQRAEVVWGSPHYFSPEQAKGEQPSARSDVYSIGIVMFEMLTGRLPYTGTNQQELAMAHIRERVPLVTEFNPSVPAGLAELVKQAMAKEPAERFRDADQFSARIKQYREQANGATINNAKSVIPPAPPVAGAAAPEVPPAPPVMPRQPTPPPANAAPVPTRPPGVGATPYIPPVPPASSEPTMKFSAAPAAPNPYNPRQQAPAPGMGPVADPRSPMYPSGGPAPQQGYPVPPARPFGPDSGQYFPPQYSQPMRPMEAGEGRDYVTIALAILAVIAILGLIPVWVIALSAR